jgi:hypothetical protein
VAAVNVQTRVQTVLDELPEEVIQFLKSLPLWYQSLRFFETLFVRVRN